MSKYDFEIDLSDTSSTGIILKKIKPASTVLEFGCATGRMTRYMKESLNCRVYIVEYEKSAFDVAMQYAEDGICDDILTLSWVERFKNVNFDAVIFADVLEHLVNPELALSNAKKVLKEDGRVYISIPNITHNDILLKAFNNHFDYTKVGILDDTHVHFWGLENIEPFVTGCGLSLLDIEATYCETGYTEQYAGTPSVISRPLLNYFNERRCGNVYQFIITLGENGENINDVGKFLKNPSIKSHVFYDDGTGFNEQNIYEFASEMTANGQYLAHFVVNNVENIKKLRFDPVELQGCILRYLSIRQSGMELKPVFNDCVEIESGVLFLCDDPMVCVDINPDAGTVIIDAEFIVSSQEYETRLKNVCVRKQSELAELRQNFNVKNEELRGETNRLTAENEELRGETNRLTAENEELRGETNRLTAENEVLRGETNRLTVENESLRMEIDRHSAENEGLRGEVDRHTAENEGLRGQINKHTAENKNLQEETNRLTVENESLRGEKVRLIAENEDLRVDLSAYIILANNKDALLIDKEQCINELNQRVTWYQDRLCVRVCDKIWRILREIKQRVFRRQNNE